MEEYSLDNSFFTFSGSFHSQFSNIKNPLKIDYKYLMELLQNRQIVGENKLHYIY